MSTCEDRLMATFRALEEQSNMGENESPGEAPDHPPHGAQPSPTSYYLPGNPMPYMAPSVTHQPELLLLHWMLDMLQSLISTILNHPLVLDPVPGQRTFNASRLFVQLRNALHRLAPLILDITQGRRLLQFLPGSPGTPGHYRMDPNASFPPHTSNFLSTTPAHTIPPPHAPSQ